jgi:hypothetical protein
MKQKLKQGSAIGALLMAMVISPLVSAAQMNFTNNSGVYTGSDGVIATVTPNTSGISYSSGNGIGVGTGTSEVTSGENLTVLFNSRVTIQSVLLANWANPFLIIFVQDRVQFSYPVNPVNPASSVFTSANSVSSGVGTFNIANLSVDGIRIANPQTGGWYVKTINYTQVPLPATAWLFGTALLGLGLMKRKKAA